MDVDVNEFLAALDSEHIRLLHQFDIKNFDTRAKALAALTDTYLDAVREMKDKNWPASIFSEAVATMNNLRSRIATQNAEDFPARYRKADVAR